MNDDDLIRTALAERAEATPTHPTPMSDIRGNARMMQRRRWVTTGLAAAAAVAVVAVPAAVLLPGRDRAAGPADTSTTGASDSPTAPSSAPTSTGWNGNDLADLPLGRPPGIDYVDGDTYTGIAGDRTTDPVIKGATAVVPTRGGLLVSKQDATGLAQPAGIQDVWMVDGNGSQRLGVGSPRFALSADGVESAWWLASDDQLSGPGQLYAGVLNTMGEQGAVPLSTPAHRIIDPVGFLPQGTVVTDWSGDTSHRRAEVIGTDGTITPIDGLAQANGVDESHGLVSGRLADGEDGGVVDTQGQVLWHCGCFPGQFSEDGNYVVAWFPMDGFVDTLAILDAQDGHTVAETGISGAADVAWDGDSLLTVVNAADGQAIVRLTTDGTVTRATPIRQHPAYALGTRP